MHSVKWFFARLFCALTGREHEPADERTASVSEERLRFAVQRAREAVDRKGVVRTSRRFTFWDDNDTGSGGGITRHEG